MTLRVLTDIYSPEIEPARDGWYLTKIDGAFLPGAVCDE